MAGISKNVLAALLILSIMVSALGTWAALSSLAGNQIPVSGEDGSSASGRVTVYVTPPPVETEGKVLVEVVES